MKIAASFVLLLVLCQVCLGGTINVPGDYGDIQTAYDIAGYGDTILVALGTYVENIQIGSKKIVLLSSSGYENTVLNPADPYEPIIFISDDNGNHSEINGFTISGTQGAVGIRCINAGPTVKNCDISYNSTIWEDGAGFYCLNSSIKIRHNKIHHNDGSVTGGGIALHGYQEDALIEYNEIYANRAPHGSGIGCPANSHVYPTSYVENVIIRYNTIYDNVEEPKSSPPPGHENDPVSDPSGYAAAGVYIHGYNCTVQNNTIVNNPRGIKILEGDDINITLNIVAWNQKAGIEAADAMVNYNNFFGNGTIYYSATNISENPMFCNYYMKDFSLSANSPCLAGNPGNPWGMLMGAIEDPGCQPRAMILIDRSGSMVYANPLGQTRLERAKQYAKDDISRLVDPDDSEYEGVIETALMYFNADGIVLAQDFTSDTNLLYTAIDNIPGPRHDTPLAAAMCQANCTMSELGGATGYIFTFTDGLENASPGFETCFICEDCDQYMESGWNYDCNPYDTSTCTEWQRCISNVIARGGVNLVRYYGDVINPFDKGNEDNLPDLYLMKSVAESSDGLFEYYSDLTTVCGDANSDGFVNVSDAVYLLNYVFVSGDAPQDITSADTNCDDDVNVSDAVWIINYIFAGGEIPCAICE